MEVFKPGNRVQHGNRCMQIVAGLATNWGIISDVCACVFVCDVQRAIKRAGLAWPCVSQILDERNATWTEEGDKETRSTKFSDLHMGKQEKIFLPKHQQRSYNG